jgi:abortive infection bacteriophage resistance protein
MPLIPYNKLHATPTERIAHLRSRGLLIKSPNVAAEKIEAIGYERLRIYFLSRRQTNSPGKPFIPGTTYQDIINLYECDAKLRDACFSAVGKFELLFRNAISEALSIQYGSHPYVDTRAFNNEKARCKAIWKFYEIYTKSTDRRAVHYRDTYSDPILPPIWTMKEFLTFGSASHTYKLLEGPIRTKIAALFGVQSDDVFKDWVVCLVNLRNICAHHDRLFNRSFQRQPSTLRRAGIPTAPRHKLKAILECLDYMLTKRGVNAAVTTKVGRIIARCPQVSPNEAGY